MKDACVSQTSSNYTICIKGSKQIFYEESSDSSHSSKNAIGISSEKVKKSMMDDASIVEQRKILIQGLKRRLNENIPNVSQRQVFQQFGDDIDICPRTVLKKSVIDHDPANAMEHGYYSKFDQVRNEESSLATNIQEDELLMTKDDSTKLSEKTPPKKIVNGNLSSSSTGPSNIKSERTVRFEKVDDTEKTINLLSQIIQFFRRFRSGDSNKKRPHSPIHFPINKNNENKEDREPMVGPFCKQSCFESLKKKISNLVTYSHQIYKSLPCHWDSMQCSKETCVLSLCNIPTKSYIYLLKLKNSWKRFMCPIMVHIKIHILQLPDKMKKIVLIIFKGTKILFRFATASENNIHISLSSLIISMSAELYPTVPRHGIALSGLFFYMKSKKVSLTSDLTCSGINFRPSSICHIYAPSVLI